MTHLTTEELDKRPEFEVWARANCGMNDESLALRENGHYECGRTCDMFEAWCAAQARACLPTAAAPAGLTADALAQMLVGTQVNDYGYRMLLNGEEIGLNLSSLLEIVQLAAKGSSPATQQGDFVSVPRKLLKGWRATLMDGQYLMAVDELDTALAATQQAEPVGLSEARIKEVAEQYDLLSIQDGGRVDFSALVGFARDLAAPAGPSPVSASPQAAVEPPGETVAWADESQSKLYWAKGHPISGKAGKVALTYAVEQQDQASQRIAELQLAAELLEHYAKYCYEVKPVDIERHPYIPQIEQTAADLRAMIAEASIKAATGSARGRNTKPDSTESISASAPKASRATKSVPLVATREMILAGMPFFRDKRDPASKAWEVYRAMLGASPAATEATKQPELTVWYGSMPESNGKSNFTATLMRKGSDFFDTDQYTFSRSEHPDRVRYEADFMSYLIGERAERPEMWGKGYDFEKHSGYKSAATEASGAAVPDAVRDVLAERHRQVEQEGWTPEHDDGYILGQLATAAASYTLHTCTEDGLHYWPWPRAWWKPVNARRDLVKAGALIIAEIERIDRAAIAAAPAAPEQTEKP